MATAAAAMGGGAQARVVLVMEVTRAVAEGAAAASQEVQAGVRVRVTSDRDAVAQMAKRARQVTEGS